MSKKHDPLSISHKNPLGKPDKVKSPKVKEPAVMPTPDDAEVQRARRRSLAAQRQRSGRASTVLSQGESLG